MDKKVLHEDPHSPSDPEVGRSSNDLAREIEELSLKNLNLENKLLNIENRERSLGYWLKVAGSFLGILLVLFLSISWAHIMHQVFVGPFVLASTPVVVALAVTPIVAITTVTGGLLAAAFRGKKDLEAETTGIVNTVANGIRGEL